VGPGRVLIYDLVILAALLTLLWLRGRSGNVVHDLGDPLAGFLPLIVPWAGALGGVTKSLFGVARYTADWDPKWNLWHALRPILGAASGVVAFLIVAVVLKTANGAEVEAIVISPESLALFFVIAFVVGFKDKYFLELLSKVAGVLFSNGDETADGAVAYSLSDSSLDFTGRNPAVRTLTMVVAGETKPTLDAGWLTVTPPFVAEASDVVTDVPGGTRYEIAVSYPAGERGPDAGVLVTVVGGVSRVVQLRGGRR
jgi:hypothetical protein